MTIAPGVHPFAFVPPDDAGVLLEPETDVDELTGVLLAAAETFAFVIVPAEVTANHEPSTPWPFVSPAFLSPA